MSGRRAGRELPATPPTDPPVSAAARPHTRKPPPLLRNGRRPPLQPPSFFEVMRGAARRPSAFGGPAVFDGGVKSPSQGLLALNRQVTSKAGRPHRNRIVAGQLPMPAPAPRTPATPVAPIAVMQAAQSELAEQRQGALACQRVHARLNALLDLAVLSLDVLVVVSTLGIVVELDRGHQPGANLGGQGKLRQRCRRDAPRQRYRDGKHL